jgi:uncharacterized membrane protein YeaQ/YmgE (transglycosylase-associated protein family)
MLVLELALFVTVGLLAGWLANALTRGRAFGQGLDLVIGVVGAVFGGWVMQPVILPRGGTLQILLLALATAGILLFVARIAPFPGRADREPSRGWNPEHLPEGPMGRKGMMDPEDAPAKRD